MSSSHAVEHQGRIAEIKGDIVKIDLLDVSSCSACHAHDICVAARAERKTVEIRKQSADYRIGDHVTVIFEESMGLKALFLGYLLPFFLLISTLFIASSFIKRELYAGLVALSVLFPYYVLLFFYRDHLKETFAFKVRKV